uniref:RING-type domain-containing protein n=1 Tax=Ficedula albicollis TaxID=59894 RepID=A0A803W226_FICAL
MQKLKTRENIFFFLLTTCTGHLLMEGDISERQIVTSAKMDGNCAICQDTWDDVASALPCGHLFCQVCILLVVSLPFALVPHHGWHPCP